MHFREITLCFREVRLYFRKVKLHFRKVKLFLPGELYFHKVIYIKFRNEMSLVEMI